MKKEDLPQDDGALNKLTRELCYVQDEKGNYVTELSTGWEVKAKALDAAWKDIDSRIEHVRQSALKGEVSPVSYFMELRLMDLDILSAYTGIWKWRIRRHLKPEIFKTLSDRTLLKYARAFNVSLPNLIEMKE
jgi:hypothetical protein